MKNVLVSALTAAAVGACFYAIGPLLAARSTSGVMSPLNGPYIAGTTIDQVQVNARLADIENEITDSYSRSGKGKMTSDGTVSAPAFSWNSDLGSGLYRIGAGDVGMSISGAKVGEWTANGLKMPSTAPLNLNSKGANPSVEFNLVYDGANQTYLTTAPGAIMEMDGSGNINFYTAPSGTAATTATVTKRVIVNPSGLLIGASGTAISGSFRGTTTSIPGSVAGNACLGSGFITVTGAAVGAECNVGVPAAGPNGLNLTCYVSSTNNCVIQFCNGTSGALTPTAGTYSCRVFNP